MTYKVISTEYRDLIQNIKYYFNEASIVLQKARNEIRVISFNKEETVVKSFKIPHVLNKIVYTFFRDSKAKKSYLYSMKILPFVPKPIGYIEYRKFALLDESYFICERFNYDFTIREVLLDKDFKDKRAIFKAFARFTHDLHEANIEHLDYSPGNILIKKRDDKYIFKIIDINRMTFRTLNTNERLENFSKLWAKDEDLKSIVRFYNEYMHIDEVKAIDIALKASQKHKDKKNFKKRLKGIEVVD